MATASLSAISKELRARGSMPVGMVQARFGVSKQTASKLLREGQSKRMWTVKQGAVLPMRMPKATLSEPRVRTTGRVVRKRKRNPAKGAKRTKKATKPAAARKESRKRQREAEERRKFDAWVTKVDKELMEAKKAKRAAPKRKPAAKKTAPRSVGRAKTSRTKSVGRKPMAKKQRTAKQKAATKRMIAANKARRRKWPAVGPGLAAKARAAKPRRKAAAKPKRRSVRARVISAAASRGKARRVSRKRMRPGTYIRARTGRKVRVTKNPIGRNTKDLMVAGVGLGLGLVGASMLDRYVATLPAQGSEKAFVGTGAITKIQEKPTNARIAAQAIGTGAAGIGSYLLKKKSPTGAYLLGGVAVGFGVKLFQCVVDGMLMPALLKAEKPLEDTFANRMYPEFQTYGQNSGAMTGPNRPFAFRARRGQVGNPSPQIGPVAEPSGQVAGCSCGNTKSSHPGLDRIFPGSAGCGPAMPYGCGQPGCGGLAPSVPGAPSVVPGAPPVVVPSDEPVAGRVPIVATTPEYPKAERTSSLVDIMRLAQGQMPPWSPPTPTPLVR